jgi:hypothetical protein
MSRAARRQAPQLDGPYWIARFFWVLRTGSALTEAERDVLLIGRLVGLCRGAEVTPPADLITLWSERHRAVNDERKEER